MAAIRYSYSALETFRGCPRRFFYRSVACARSADHRQHITAFVGTRVHEALEHLYAEILRGRVETLPNLLRFYKRRWLSSWSDAVAVPEEGDTPERHMDLGCRCLADYYRRHQPFDRGRTVALEQRLMFTIDGREGERHPFVGVIDRLVRLEDGTWEIHDYKTTRQLPTQAEQDADEQLALYELGLRQCWRDVGRVELVWHFLSFDRTIRSARTSAQLERLHEATLATIRDIESRGSEESAFPAVEAGHCDSCEFRSVCPVGRRRVGIRVLPEREWERGDGGALVDRWASIEARKAELASKLAKFDAQATRLRAAIITRAQERGLSEVRGTAARAIVERTTVVRSAVAHAGDGQPRIPWDRLWSSSLWPRISGIDLSRLAIVWSNRENLEPADRDMLHRCFREEQELALRLEPETAPRQSGPGSGEPMDRSKCD